MHLRAGTTAAATGTRRALRAACLTVAVLAAWWVLAVVVGGTAHAADQQGPLGRVTERAGLGDPVGDVVRRLAPVPTPAPAPAPQVRQAPRVPAVTPIVRTVEKRVTRPAQRVVAQVTRTTPAPARVVAPAPSPAAPTSGRGAATRPVPAATGTDAARAVRPTRTTADLTGAVPSTLDRTLANVGARLGLVGLELPAVADLAGPVTSPVTGIVDRVALTIHAAAGPVLRPVLDPGLRPVVGLVPPVVGAVLPGPALVGPAATVADLAGRSAQRILTAADDRPAPGPGTGPSPADRSSTASLLMTDVLYDTAVSGPAAVSPDPTHGRFAADDWHELPAGAQPAPAQAGSSGAPGPLALTTGHQAGTTPALGRGTTTPDAATMLRGRPAPEPGSSPG